MKCLDQIIRPSATAHIWYLALQYKKERNKKRVWLQTNSNIFSQKGKCILTGWWWYKSIETADKEGDDTPYVHFRFWRRKRVIIKKEEEISWWRVIITTMVVTGLSQVDTEHVMDLTEPVMWHTLTLGERTKQNNNSNAPRLQTLFSTETTKFPFDDVTPFGHHQEERKQKTTAWIWLNLKSQIPLNRNVSTNNTLNWNGEQKLSTEKVTKTSLLYLV